MYCMILYGVPPERFVSAPATLPASQKSSQRQSTRPPDNILYVNPDCALQILIHYIRSELHIEPNDEIDFCNLNGDLLHIEECEPALNATNLFEPYAKYICVLKLRNDDGILSKLTPLISNSYSEVSLKLRRHVRMSRRLSFEIKKIHHKEKENEYIVTTSFRRSKVRLTKSRHKSPK